MTSKAGFFGGGQRTRNQLHYIRPGKPTQNAFVESFNGSFRDSRLNQHWLRDPTDATCLIADWQQHYNKKRPHNPLGYPPLVQYTIQAAGQDDFPSSRLGSLQTKGRRRFNNATANSIVGANPSAVITFL